MKGLLCIMVDVHSSQEDFEHVMKLVESSAEKARERVEGELNHGATYHAQIGIRKSDPRNKAWLQQVMGQVLAWSIGKIEVEPVKKKSFLRHLWEDDW